MKTWKPSPRQEDFLALPDSIFEALYGGAAGGGKSEVLLNLPIVRGFTQIPGFKGILMRRTYPELEKSLILRSMDYYKPIGADWNGSLRRWRFPSGAILDFGYAEHEADVRKYDTTEYNYIGLDEVTSFTEFQYIYMTSRCRTSNPQLPSIIRCASNPGNIGHGWCRKRFVEPDKNGYKIILDMVTKQKRIFIPAKCSDNPYLMSADPGYQDRLKILPIAERKAKLDGDWWVYEGQVFEDFRTTHFKDEPDNALHVVEPFDIPTWWPVVVAGDWGYTAMTWFGLAAVSPTGQVFLFKEYWAQRKLISTWATELGRIVDRYRDQLVENVALDPSAWQKRGDEETISQQFAKHSGYDPQKADNDRVGGKNLLQEYIRWRPRPARVLPRTDYNQDLADRILRMYGLKAYQEYLGMFVPEKPETNLPKLQIFKDCTKVINAIQLCVYDEDSKEDVAEFVGDDPYDGLRYLVKLCDKWLHSGAKKAATLAKVGQIEQDLQTSGDYTSFYRKMEKLEHQSYDNDPTVMGFSRRKPSTLRIIR